MQGFFTASTGSEWTQNFLVLDSVWETSVPVSESFYLTKARGSRVEMKAERRDGTYHKARNPDQGLKHQFPASRFSPAHCSQELLGIFLEVHRGRKVHQRWHSTWSGMFQTKVLWEKLYLSKWKRFLNDNLFLKGFSLGCFPGQKALPQTPNSEWQRAPTRAAPAPASAACFFFPLKSFKRSHFCLIQNGNHLLKCQGVFTNDTSFFPDWPWTTGSYALFPFLQPSRCRLPSIVAFCTPWLIWSWSSWETAPLQVLA